MDPRARASHKRSSSESAPFTPAPRPSFVPFSACEPEIFGDDEDGVQGTPQGELSLLRSFIRETLGKVSSKSSLLTSPPPEPSDPLFFSPQPASQPHCTFPVHCSQPWHPDTTQPLAIQTESVPGSLNRSKAQSPKQSPLWTHATGDRVCRSKGSATKHPYNCQNADAESERTLWKKLITQLLAVSVPKKHEMQATRLCADFESQLGAGKSVPEALVSFHSQALLLFDSDLQPDSVPSNPDTREDWKKKCEFYMGLLEQQNEQIEAMKREKADFLTSDKATDGSDAQLSKRILSLQEELTNLKKQHEEAEQGLSQKLKSLEDGRKLIIREKTALAEACQQLTATNQDLISEKSTQTRENTHLKDTLAAEISEKAKLVEERNSTKRQMDMLRLKIVELEEGLASGQSPYGELRRVGEQLGTQFTTVTDLFNYLTSHLQTSDPDQESLLEAYQGLNQHLGAPIAASSGPTFISAMLSFLLIRKKMIEEEREMQGYTLLGLKSQLESAHIELDIKKNAYSEAMDLVNSLKSTIQSQELELDLREKRSETAEEELKVLKKAHDRHIELYKCELEGVQQRLQTAEQTVVEKTLESESLRTSLGELIAKIKILEEENTALENENSFLTYERKELHKDLLYTKLTNVPMDTSMQELYDTLQEIHAVLKEQRNRESDLETLITTLHFQLEARQSEYRRLKEEHCMLLEDIRTRDWERTSSERFKGQLDLLRGEKEKLVREMREVAHRLGRVTVESGEIVGPAESCPGDQSPIRQYEVKYARLKQLYHRLESVVRRLLNSSKPSSRDVSVSELEQKEARLSDIEQQVQVCNPNLWDQSLDRMSEVARLEESFESRGRSLLEEVQVLTSNIKGSVTFDGIHWILAFDSQIGYFWVKDGEEYDDIARMVSVYREIESLLEPYLSEFDDVTIAFSKILQEYEQMKRGTEDPRSGISAFVLEDASISQSQFVGSVLIHNVMSGERPPARLSNYSDDLPAVDSSLGPMGSPLGLTTSPRPVGAMDSSIGPVDSYRGRPDTSRSRPTISRDGVGMSRGGIGTSNGDVQALVLDLARCLSGL